MQVTLIYCQLTRAACDINKFQETVNETYYVIGGGIIGLLCAHELRLAGKPVVVIDRQTVGKEASWAGGGILSPLYPWRYSIPVNTLAHWSQARYPGLIQELAVATGLDAQWTPSGLLIFGAEDQQQAWAWAVAQDVDLQKLAHPDICRIEPLVSSQLETALWLPEVAQVRNPRLLAALCADLRQSGVEFRENIEVTGFNEHAGDLTEIQTTQGAISTNRCLLASGAWSGELLANTGIELPIKPMKGQMLLLSTPRVSLKRMVLKNHRYLVPRRDGQILVGSTLEDTGFEKSTTMAARNELLQAAVEMVPGLAHSPVERHWAGLRPGSADGMPYIGEHPGISGLFVCSGHFRNGIVLGPASARLVVDMVLGRAPIVDPAPFRLLRASN